MDRAEATGLGVAVAGHGLLLAVLVVGLATVTRSPPPVLQTPIEISFAEDIALQSAAPAAQAPAPSLAPDLGPPEDAAPAPAPEPAPLPEPAPPLPQPPAPAPPPPAPAPPRPAPKQAPPERPAPRARPAPERPATKAAPAPERPAPKAAPAPERPAARATPKQAAPARPSQQQARPPAPARAAARPAPATGSGQAERPRGSRLGPDLLKGIGSDPSPAREARPQGAVMNARAVTNIASAIQRQVQPCADRQIIPGPGAERIATEIVLRLNRDGSLAGQPRVGRQTGLDDENRRYADRVADLAKRSFVECAPLRGLPDDLYDVPNGWRNFTLRFRLPD